MKLIASKLSTTDGVVMQTNEIHRTTIGLCLSNLLRNPFNLAKRILSKGHSSWPSHSDFTFHSDCCLTINLVITGKKENNC